MVKTKTDWHADTTLVHAGVLRSAFNENSESLFLTQGFVYETAEQAEARFKGESDGFIYSRFSNPTVAMFEQRMAALEGAEDARATASGMAAVTAAILSRASAGDHIVAPRALFASCRYIIEDLAPRFGIDYTLIDGCDPGAWEAAMRPQTRVCFLESPTNPRLDVIDIAAVAQIARAHGAVLIVDNVFATPLGQQPLALGADVVIYSTTKHIDGQGRCLGGVLLASKAYIDEYVHDFLRQTGPCMSPFNAWVMLKGLETLAVRVARQERTASRLADFLAAHEAVRRVWYPTRADHPQSNIVARQMHHGGTLVTFDVKGDRAACFRFLNALEIVRISNNLGDAKSLVTHPATTTHQRLGPQQRAEQGITDAMVRLSVGLEHVDDLCDDLSTALERVRS